MIKKDGERWCVYDSDGKKKLGCHPTKAAALKQLRAIEAKKTMTAVAEFLIECDRRLKESGNE